MGEWGEVGGKTVMMSVYARQARLNNPLITRCRPEEMSA